MSEFTFVLEKEAKSKGGDKYVCESNPEFNIYIPQNISRKEGKVSPKLIITVYALSNRLIHS